MKLEVTLEINASTVYDFYDKLNLDISVFNPRYYILRALYRVTQEDSVFITDVIVNELED